MIKTTVRLAFRRDEESPTVPAYETHVPGIVVCRCQSGAGPRYWQLVQAATGYSLGPSWDSREHAVDALRGVDAEAVDWTRDAQTVGKDPEARAIYHTIKCTAYQPAYWDREAFNR